MTDEQYELERNKLIPEAVAYANEIVGDIPSVGEGSRSDKISLWNRTFLARMDELWRAYEAGL